MEVPPEAAKRPPTAGPGAAPAESPVQRAPVKSAKLKLNGKDLEVPAGTNLIEAARREGVHIPYFCYHPGLTPAGNCRMCLVEASNSKKPITACTTPVTDGLEIFTETENVKKARAGVLELMLINHPLDCPICDKSGECMLQDHTFDHGKDRSRMVEPKVLKPTKEVGKDIYIWGNRCIVCTRCVRFCEEIAGTGELCVVERGDHSVIDVLPEYPLQNNLSGNVVDICPVGALISKDFLYKARVWYQKKTQSICNACARGCNIEVQTLDNKLKRLVPRHNPHVNDYWMCDHGRHDIHYVLGESRSLHYRLGDPADPSSSSVGPVTAPGLSAGKRLAEALERTVRTHGPASIAGIASAFMTIEEAFLFRKLLETLGAPRESIAAWGRPPGREEVFRSGFRIAADKNPNRAGVTAILGAGAFDRRLDGIVAGIESGALKGIIIASDRPHVRLGEGPDEGRLAAALAKLDLVVVFELETGGRVPDSALVLPATAFSEKDGTMVNDRGRIQLLRRGTELPRGIRSEHEVLQEALVRLGSWGRPLSAGGVFREAARELGLEGVTHRDIGLLGLELPAGAPPAGEGG
jgi:NADH-quinone oxidoreductase subunit G